MKPAHDEYISIHIYYNAHDLRPVLLDCVAPLIKQLLEERMTERYFVVRYWEGGSHVRLRLRPGPQVNPDTVRALATCEIERFFRISPSLFEPNRQALGESMRTMFISEYGLAAFNEKYGQTGSIPVERNNSYRFVSYMPEYDRYGGPYGIDLSEEHFQLSTAIALRLLGEVNCQVRTSLLGLALQLMLHFAFAYFSDVGRTRDFFHRYCDFFLKFSPAIDIGSMDVNFDRQAEKIRSRVENLDRTHSLIQSGALGPIGEFARSAAPLRERITQLFDAGRLNFVPPVATADEAGQRLLMSYLHMLNNRLGVHIAEEVYIAYMLDRSLGEIDEHHQ